ncbi:MAG: hypothetical protein JRF30_11830 [Deltaproteobacteria bacterium]|nr:hypothetical protein [Deltaproteobacteria bacterium]MBW2331575.1 hypothetical protein [Deltaproteobacteria bacterium]
MDETQRREPTRYREEQFEDEIELMDYLRVMWKWKYLIMAGTLICAVAAGVISFSTPKVYRIDMVIQPGILTMNEAGKGVYVDSPKNIKAMIEAGTFDRVILDHIGESNNHVLPKSLKFKTNIPKNSNALKVSYETSNVKLGLKALDHLHQLLLRNSERVEYFRNRYETQIGLKKDQVGDCEARRRALQQHIKNIQKRMDELTSQIEFIRSKRNLLMKQRDKFFSNNTSESNVLAAVLHTNTIQQNIALENTYRQEVNEYMTKIDDKKLNLQELNSESKRLSEEIKGLESKKNNMQSIEILQPPTASAHPIKPKIKLNVMLATVVGLFVMLFLAFFLEYIQRHKGEPGP